ncbi:hypothetical protein T10_11646 [Trichinella papuae]|uniref:Uncharacterized protein n=1 Tax=Trichinella papuae TaxID=268474 RepID=A0A0V1M595_9BILA|nr:hypothetical protein T10_11646 [Trichinella papuae]
MEHIILPRSGLQIALLPVLSLVQRMAQQSMHGQQYPTEIPHHINVGLHSSLIIIKCAGSYADEIFESVWIVGLIIRDGFRYGMEIPGVPPKTVDQWSLHCVITTFLFALVVAFMYGTVDSVEMVTALCLNISVNGKAAVDACSAVRSA